MDEQNKKLFPQPGDYFAIYPMSELAVKETSEDGYMGKDMHGEKSRKDLINRFYNDTVFKCVDANETRIVCRPVPLEKSAWYTSDRVLARSDWRIDDINSLLPALGIEQK